MNQIEPGGFKQKTSVINRPNWNDFSHKFHTIEGVGPIDLWYVKTYKEQR